MWALYGALMLFLGGKNPSYGTGWTQWNYVRWMLALHDAASPVDLGAAFTWALLFPASLAASIGSIAYAQRRLREEDFSSVLDARLPMIVALCLQAAMLPIVVWADTRPRFWWPKPRTAIPIMTVGFFEIATTIFWFLAPLFTYWITMSLAGAWQKRHGLPPETPPVEETHLS